MAHLLVVDDSRVMREMVIACLRGEAGVIFRPGRQRPGGHREALTTEVRPDGTGPEHAGYWRVRGHRVRARAGQGGAACRSSCSPPGATRPPAPRPSSWAPPASSPSRSRPRRSWGLSASWSGSAAAVAGEPGSLDAAEFISGYLVEVDEHLTSATRNLLDGRRRPEAGRWPARGRSASCTARCTRSRGCRPWSAFEPMVDIAHAMESVLREADAAGASSADHSFDLLMKGLAAVEQRVRAVGRKETAAPAPAGAAARAARRCSPGAGRGVRRAPPSCRAARGRRQADGVRAGSAAWRARATAGGRSASRWCPPRRASPPGSPSARSGSGWPSWARSSRSCPGRGP